MRTTNLLSLPQLWFSIYSASKDNNSSLAKELPDPKVNKEHSFLKPPLLVIPSTGPDQQKAQVRGASRI